MTGLFEDASAFAGLWIALLAAWVILIALGAVFSTWIGGSDTPWIATPLRMIRRSRGLLAYLALGALTWTFLTWRDSGPWAAFTGSDVELSTSDMLPMAAALLALLLFAANFLHGISKQGGDSEKYLGEPVERYLSIHAWPMEIISGNLFRTVTLLLFVIPLTLEWWQLTVLNTWDGGLLAASLWSASFFIVGLTLIFSVLSVLRSSGTLLRSRDFVKFQIRDDLQSTSRHRIRNLARQNQDISKDAEFWCKHHLISARGLPREEHSLYLRATVTSTEYDIAQRSLRDRAIRWHPLWKGRSRLLVTRLKDLNLGRWKAAAAALVDESISPEIREELVRLLQWMARTMETLSHREQRSSLPKDLQNDLMRKPSQTPVPSHRPCPAIGSSPRVGADEEPVVMITYICFREVIQTSLPSGAPSRCRIEDLKTWIRICENLHHHATREIILGELTEAFLRSAIIERVEVEELPEDSVEKLYSHYGDRRVRVRVELTSIQRRLAGAAFRAIVGSPSMAPDKVRRLLPVLQPVQKRAALLYVLQYRHREGRPVSPQDLKPYAEAFMDTRIGIEDKHEAKTAHYLKERIRASAISHILSPDDVDWLVNILTTDQGYETVRSYLRYENDGGLNDFPLRELLLWRYIAGPVDRYFFNELGQENFPGLTETEHRSVRRQIISAAAAIEEIDADVYRRYRHDFWLLLDDSPDGSTSSASTG